MFFNQYTGKKLVLGCLLRGSRLATFVAIAAVHPSILNSQVPNVSVPAIKGNEASGSMFRLTPDERSRVISGADVQALERFLAAVPAELRPSVGERFLRVEDQSLEPLGIDRIDDPLLMSLLVEVWAPRRRRLAADTAFWRQVTELERWELPVLVVLVRDQPDALQQSYITRRRTEFPTDAIVLSEDFASGEFLALALEELQQDRRRSPNPSSTERVLDLSHASSVRADFDEAREDRNREIARLDTWIADLRSKEYSEVRGIGVARAAEFYPGGEASVEYPAWDPRWRP